MYQHIRYHILPRLASMIMAWNLAWSCFSYPFTAASKASKVLPLKIKSFSLRGATTHQECQRYVGIMIAMWDLQWSIIENGAWWSRQIVFVQHGVTMLLQFCTRFTEDGASSRCSGIRCNVFQALGWLPGMEHGTLKHRLLTTRCTLPSLLVRDACVWQVGGSIAGFVSHRSDPQLNSAVSSKDKSKRSDGESGKEQKWSGDIKDVKD